MRARHPPGPFLFLCADARSPLALAWRRLHDTNRSGWWWLLNLIPIVGWIIVIVFQAQRSDLAGVRFDR